MQAPYFALINLNLKHSSYVKASLSLLLILLNSTCVESQFYLKRAIFGEN